MSSFLRLGDKGITLSQLIPLQSLCLLSPPFAQDPLLSTVPPRKTEGKSWIPNGAGLLRHPEISVHICLTVKPAIPAKSVLKSGLEFLGLAGFVVLSCIKQAFGPCSTMRISVGGRTLFKV